MKNPYTRIYIAFQYEYRKFISDIYAYRCGDDDSPFLNEIFQFLIFGSVNRNH